MINDPFKNDNNDKIEEKYNLGIEIWIEQFGRKKNTYISGWNLDDNELKEHIKIFKRNHGCNGTLKINENNIKVVMFQGDQINNIISYFKKINIDIDNINIKGLNG